MIPFYILISYLLGSITTGFFIARIFKGIDIRRYGSGNVGATNIYRVLGKKWGIVVFLLDFLKGFAVVFLGGRVFWQGISWVPVVSGIAVICGHLFPVFLGFRGGKAVATSCGVFLALCPEALFFSSLLFIIVVYLTRYVSLGSITAAVFLPLFIMLFRMSREVLYFSLIVSLAVVLRHLSNIKRLIKGSESKFVL